VIGADTSFLVGLAIREHPAHPTCWRLFKEEMLGQPGAMAVAPQVLAEFAHVVTDPRRFEHALDREAALALCEQWWQALECFHVSVDPEATVLFMAWMSELGLGRKRLLDTLLAASYHRAGVVRLASTDWRAFERYGVFDVIALA